MSNNFNTIDNCALPLKYKIFDKNSSEIHEKLLSFLAHSSSNVKTRNQLIYYYKISFLLMQEDLFYNDCILKNNEYLFNIKEKTIFYDKCDDSKILFEVFDATYFENITEKKYIEFIHFASNIYRGDFNLYELFDFLNMLNIKLDSHFLLDVGYCSENYEFKLFISELIYYCG